MVVYLLAYLLGFRFEVSTVIQWQDKPKTTLCSTQSKEIHLSAKTCMEKERTRENAVSVDSSFPKLKERIKINK